MLLSCETVGGLAFARTTLLDLNELIEKFKVATSKYTRPEPSEIEHA